MLKDIIRNVFADDHFNRQLRKKISVKKILGDK